MKELKKQQILMIDGTKKKTNPSKKHHLTMTKHKARLSINGKQNRTIARTNKTVTLYKEQTILRIRENREENRHADET